MFVISKVIIEERVAHEHFACDLGRCKGACCTLPGGRGAPLQDDEVRQIEEAYPVVEKYLPERSRVVIRQAGMFEGMPGSYATSCIDNRDCVFVYRERGVAYCAIEKAYHHGETVFRKPISCFLFPVRVSPDEPSRIRYEHIAECSGGRARGRSKEILLSQFLKDALVGRFGAGWYSEFEAACYARRENGEDIESRIPSKSIQRA